MPERIRYPRRRAVSLFAQSSKIPCAGKFQAATSSSLLTPRTPYANIFSRVRRENQQLDGGEVGRKPRPIQQTHFMQAGLAFTEAPSCSKEISWNATPGTFRPRLCWAARKSVAQQRVTIFTHHGCMQRIGHARAGLTGV